MGNTVRAVLCVVALFAIIVESSHNRGGFISWKISPSNPKTVTFTFTHAWRSSATSGIGVYFGDGSSVSLGPSLLTFSGTDQAGEGYSVFQETATHTYSGLGPYTVYWDGCCRVSTLQNAADTNFRVQTVVDLRQGHDSPTSSIPPLIQFPIATTATYQIGVADPNGIPFTCRLSTAAEDGFSQVATISGSVISVSPDCLLTWNTARGAQNSKYAVSVVVSQQGSSTAVPLDFIIELAPQAALPTCSVQADSPIATIGKPYSVNITGTSTAPGVTSLTMTALSLASDAKLTPPSGSSGRIPFTVNLVAVPTKPGAFSTVIVFTDSNRKQVSCSVAYQVADPTNCNLVRYSSCGVASGTTQYTLTSLNDADSLLWSSNCEGTFDSTTNDQVVFTTTTSPDALCTFYAQVTVSGVVANCSVNATCPRCTGTATPRCRGDQPAIVTVNDPASVDAYIDGDVLGVATDPDGTIIKSVSSALPIGVTLTQAGQFVVTNHSLLVAGVYNVTLTTTDQYGGVTTQVVTLVLLDISCGDGLQSCGASCYNASIHDCIIFDGKRHLCLKGNIICSIFDECCYDPTVYDCLDGGLCPKGNQKCNINGNAVCYDPNVRSCLSGSNSTDGILCYKGNQVCGTSDCFDPTVSSCINGVVCAKNEQECNKGCFNPAAYDCLNGNTLVLKGWQQCGPTVYNPAVHSCFNGHTLCPVGLQLCGDACYDPSVYSCQPDFTMCKAGYEKCGAACFDDELYICCDPTIPSFCLIGDEGCIC